MSSFSEVFFWCFESLKLSVSSPGEKADILKRQDFILLIVPPCAIFYFQLPVFVCFPAVLPAICVTLVNNCCTDIFPSWEFIFSNMFKLDYWSNIGTKKKMFCILFVWANNVLTAVSSVCFATRKHKRNDTMNTQHMTSVKRFLPSTQCLFLSTMSQRLTTSTL